MNQTTIARWEDDNRVPTMDNAIDIAKALNISLIDLLEKDLRFENLHEIAPFHNSNCSERKNNISDEAIKRCLKGLNEKEGIKILFNKDGELTEEEMNQIVSYTMFVKKQHYKNKENK